MSDFQQIAIDSLQKQYGYTNVAKLVVEKADVFDKYIGDITDTFGIEVLDYNTCIPDALDYFWGRLFKITRTFKDELDVEFTLTDTQFREIIKIKAFSTSWQGDLNSLNLFLSNLFKDRGNAICIDLQNMASLIYAFDFELEDWEKTLFKKVNILPRCAGVGINIEIIPTENKYFGYRVYGAYVENPIKVGYKLYGDIKPTGDGKYYVYGDLD